MQKYNAFSYQVSSSVASKSPPPSGSPKTPEFDTLSPADNGTDDADSSTIDERHAAKVQAYMAKAERPGANDAERNKVTLAAH